MVSDNLRLLIPSTVGCMHKCLSVEKHVLASVYVFGNSWNTNIVWVGKEKEYGAIIIANRWFIFIMEPSQPTACLVCEHDVQRLSLSGLLQFSPNRKYFTLVLGQF